MLGLFDNEIAEAIARDEYGTIEEGVCKVPKSIVARYLYLRISLRRLRRCNFAVHVDNVVRRLEQSFAMDSELSLASRKKFCCLVVDQLGRQGAVLLLDDASFGWKVNHLKGLSYVHDAVTLAIALDLPEILESYGNDWQTNGYHAVLLPSPIALASTSNFAASILDQLLLHPITANFFSIHRIEWHHISSTWEYAVRHGRKSLRRLIGYIA